MALKGAFAAHGLSQGDTAYGYGYGYGYLVFTFHCSCALAMSSHQPSVRNGGWVSDTSDVKLAMLLSFTKNQDLGQDWQAFQFISANYDRFRGAQVGPLGSKRNGFKEPDGASPRTHHHLIRYPSYLPYRTLGKVDQSTPSCRRPFVPSCWTHGTSCKCDGPRQRRRMPIGLVDFLTDNGASRSGE